MRRKISVVALTACLIVGLSISQAKALNNVQYLGKTTWTATIEHSTKPENVGVSINLTGGISKVGDEFYQFQGYATTVNVPGQGTIGIPPFVVSGSGFMMGTTLIFTLTESQNHASEEPSSPWRDGGVMHVEINTTTNPWTGTFYDIGHDFDSNTVGSPEPTFDSRYTDGTISGPSLPLGSSPVAQNTLLLLQ